MPRLTLVRHAKSSWRFGSLDDFYRPLNKRGLRDCQKMPRHVVKRVGEPALLLSSDAARAVQTAQALVDAFALAPERVRVEHRLYLAEVDTLLEEISLIDNSVSHLMMVGHNPGLSELLGTLVRQGGQAMPTFAVASLTLQVSEWAQIQPGCATLDDYFVPKELIAAN